MEKFFGGEPFTREEIIKGIKAGIKSGDFAPVYCGSAATLDGVDMLLDAITDQMLSASVAAGETAKDAAGNTIEIACSANDPLAAYVFKTVADPFVGKLSYVKVIAGQLSADIAPCQRPHRQP
jgi:elongation factor G